MPSTRYASTQASPSAPGEVPSSTGLRSSVSCCVDSAEILRGQKTVEISHNGATYRLQATRLGKLILTK